jgi:hypothetical protein
MAQRALSDRIGCGAAAPSHSVLCSARPSLVYCNTLLSGIRHHTLTPTRRPDITATTTAGNLRLALHVLVRRRH